MDIKLLFENKNSLQQATDIKVLKCLLALQTIENFIHTISGEVIPVVVSMCGATLHDTTTALRELGSTL